MVVRALTVAVIGGGYAGVTAANRLRASLSSEEASRVRVVVYSARPMFLERIRLHELVAGSRESVEVPFRDILRPDIEVVVGTVENIDAANQTLSIRVESMVRQDRFDYLIYAVGSASTRPVGAYAVSDLADVQAARGRIGTTSSVVVVGGGATGVETAAEVAEMHPDATVTLVSSGDVLSTLPNRSRKVVLKSLRRLGRVSLISGEKTILWAE